MEAVLICHNPRLGQVVLDTLYANAIKPWLILDPTTAASLQWSRLIRGTLLAKPNLASNTNLIADYIHQMRRHPPDVVLASDVEGLLILSVLQSRLEGLRFPQSEYDTLMLLNDKWAFRNLCEKLGLPTPKTLYFPRKASIDPDYIDREIGFPVVLKPTSKFSSVGLRTVSSKDSMHRIVKDVNYGFDNLIVQKFIAGQDIGLSLFARDGMIIKATTFDCGDNDATEFRPMPEFLAMASQIVAATDYTGVANFDARLDHAGEVKLLECNPRFFMRLSAVRICGLDLLRLGLPDCSTVNGQAHGSFYAKSDLLTWVGIQRVVTGRWQPRVLLRSWWEALHDPIPLIKRRTGTDRLRR
jgi:predicted ATP-grasp superfamily ATP-dependent carboligase